MKTNTKKSNTAPVVRVTFAAAIAAVAALATFASQPTFAQDPWPSKPITYVVPFPAGGTTDTLARLISQKLGPALGTTIVVENRAGAGGNIGSDFVAKAAPDGYTILGGTISSHAINATLYPKLPYDPLKSFSPITLIGTNANVLVVAASSPYQSVKDLVDASKAKPGSLSFASAGNGTSQHLSGELFKSIAGIDLVHVPYRGSAPAIADVMGGQVPFMFDTSVVAAPFIEGGKVRALAVTSAKRAPQWPNVPTMTESGVTNYEVVSWQAMFAPAGTPPAIVQRLHAEIVKIIKSADMQERFAKLGLDPSGMTPAELPKFQASEIAKWAAVIKAANINIE
jgi:tripartite-type tricarboxylate transporter receptor subunit TctC